MDGCSQLRNPFGSRLVVIVHTQAGIQGYPIIKVLPDIYITRYFVLILVHYLGFFPYFLSCYKFIPSLSSEAIPIGTYGYAVALKRLETLKPGNTRHFVTGVETIVQWSLSGQSIVSIIDFMPPPIIEQAQRARSCIVLVFYHYRSHSSGNPLVGILKRFFQRSRLRCLELSQIYISPHFPMVGPFIPYLGITSILLEVHILPMTVRPIIGNAYHTGKPSFPDAVGHFTLKGIVRTISYVGLCPYTVLLHLACNDIDDTSHRIRTIKHRSRSTEHFHPFGHHTLMRIADGMPHNTHVLRMAVYQHHHPSRTSP